MKTWKKVDTTNTFSFDEEGDEIIGKLVKKDEDGGKFDKGVYTIETEDDKKTVFGTAILTDRLKEVEEGEQVKIVYKGTVETSGGNEAKNFEVFVEE